MLSTRVFIFSCLNVYRLTKWGRVADKTNHYTSFAFGNEQTTPPQHFFHFCALWSSLPCQDDSLLGTQLDNQSLYWTENNRQGEVGPRNPQQWRKNYQGEVGPQNPEQWTENGRQGEVGPHTPEHVLQFLSHTQHSGTHYCMMFVTQHHHLLSSKP